MTSPQELPHVHIPDDAATRNPREIDDLAVSGAERIKELETDVAQLKKEAQEFRENRSLLMGVVWAFGIISAIATAAAAIASIYAVFKT